jgi:urease accessory protein
MNVRVPRATLAYTARLLQLASQSLPTGAFAYSSGLEAVVELGWVKGEDGWREYLVTMLTSSVARLEIPYFLRMYDAWEARDGALAASFSARLRASRETRELAEQEGQMGRALARVLKELFPELELDDRSFRTYAQALSLGSVCYGIPREEAATLLAYSWVEQHVTALARLLPLGPLASQKLLDGVLPSIGRAVLIGSSLKDDEIGASCPRLALASAFHETQYCRVFRS